MRLIFQPGYPPPTIRHSSPVVLHCHSEGICMSQRRMIGLIVGCVLLFPLAAFSQNATSGSIAGVARDATGAVLPGVTVEAASPALIEKVRSVVCDAQGNYKIVDLRPGTY